MPRLDPHEGILWEGDSPLTDAEVLRYLDSTFEVEAGFSNGFCLLSIKRMLDRYPSLKLINGWAEVFCEQARRVPPRLALVSSAVPAQPGSGIHTLMIRKVRSVTHSELTCDGVDLVADATPGIVSMDGSCGVSLAIRYRDKPDMQVMEQVIMTGCLEEGTTSLSLTPLGDIFHLPIRLENALDRHFQDYANPERTDIVSRTLTEYPRKAPELTLNEVLTVILMDLNLDGDEECEEARQEIQSRLQACERRQEQERRNQQADDKRER